MESSSVYGGRLDAHIRSHLPALRDAEARVAQVVLRQGVGLLDMTIAEVAALADTAPSSVVRACQRLGFRGFQQLKLAAAQQARPQPGQPRNEPSADPAAHALAETVRAAREALDGLSTTLTAARLNEAAQLLHQAGRILLVGTGLSSTIALDAACRLRALGLTVDAPTDPYTARLAASLLPPDAACLAVSHTGATRDTVDTARLAQQAGAPVIALTSAAQSLLGDLATCTLVAGGQDIILGLESVASRLAHLAAIDALVLTLLTIRGADAERALYLNARLTSEQLY